MNRERIATLEKEYLEEHPGCAGTVVPYVYYDLDELNPERAADGFPFPIITDVLLAGDWEPTDQTWFVDSSGFGRAGEPALTVDQFRRELIDYVYQNPEHGFGLSGVGPFQVYVTAYRRV